MKKRYLIPLIMIVLSVALTAAGRLSSSFADFYADNIFHYISIPYAFISGLLPFSLGEIMIVALLLLFVLGVPALLIIIIFFKKIRKQSSYFALTLSIWILAFVFSVQSLNCFTLYGCTRFSERYFTSSEHDNEQLKELYAILISEANELAEEVPRDEHGVFKLTIDPDVECRKAMLKVSDKYSQLKGYYPRPKPILFSYFMSQTGTSGMYFPFSMEANYNADMVDEIKPSVICHEYAHLKGFMQEDEANFIAFTATQESDSPEVKYSGCLDALEYVNNQIFDNKIVSAYELTDCISPKVRNDWYRFLPENYWEENESKEIISTETVSTVSDSVSDSSMKLNGVEDGIASYSRMVNLLLDYYFPAEQ